MNTISAVFDDKITQLETNVKKISEFAETAIKDLKNLKEIALTKTAKFTEEYLSQTKTVNGWPITDLKPVVKIHTNSNTEHLNVLSSPELSISINLQGIVHFPENSNHEYLDSIDSANPSNYIKTLPFIWNLNGHTASEDLNLIFPESSPDPEGHPV